MRTILNSIAGRHVEPVGGQHLQKIEPATRRVIAPVAGSDRRDVGGLISPWDLPRYLFTWKVGPALATGNTAVAKPSELTPTTAHLLTELCRDAGLPPGVFNVVHGYGAKAGAAVVAHPKVPMISFTGGTKTGADIARTAAPLFKKMSLELGGKNPTLIFADTDLDDAMPTIVRSAFENQGQICL